MFKRVLKVLGALTVAVLIFSSPVTIVHAAHNSAYYISAETDYNADDPIYIIGHKEPDTDTVCSSIAYASLLQALNYDAKAVLSGTVPVVGGILSDATESVLAGAGLLRDLPRLTDCLNALRRIVDFFIVRETELAERILCFYHASLGSRFQIIFC